MLAVAGQYGKPSNSLVQVTRDRAERDGRHRHRPRAHHPGGRARADRRAQLRRTACRRELDKRTPRLDEENVKYDVLTPDVPTGERPVARRPLPQARAAARRPPDRLVGRRPGQRHQRAVAHAARLRHLHLRSGEPGATEPARLQRQERVGALRARRRGARRAAGHRLGRRTSDDPTRPPASARSTSRNDLERHASTTCSTTRAATTSLGSPTALAGAVKVRVIEGFSSEGAKGVTMFGLTMDEGAAILGEADGLRRRLWLADIPPYVPVHLQPIDKFGMSIRNQRLWIQGMPGEEPRVRRLPREPHRRQRPRHQPEPDRRRRRKAPETFVTTPIGDAPRVSPGTRPCERRRCSRSSTAKCASCHNGTHERQQAADVLLADAAPTRRRA